MSRKAKVNIPTPEEMDALKQQLFDKAKKDGQIDQKEILKVFSESPENVEILDSLYSDLAT